MSGKAWNVPKPVNVISSEIYCADPTAAEFRGRLYVYGTNDHQQYREGKTGSNTYEAIRSLVVFSTGDMVNWQYHGEIRVGEIAPWIYASWAPSIIAREESDGLTHFYLYFSNSGCGVGVITSTDPVSGWRDPLGKPLIEAGMPTLGDVPNPFDPGAALDAQGNGWLTFGGGVAKNGSPAMPRTARIVRLGADLISLGSEFSEIPAPYFYEASELNILGDTFLYTFNTNWEPRTDWHQTDAAPATRCSMCCMTTKTPLDSASWQYRRDYFANPGDQGCPDSNNHTHLHNFCGQWYLFYHTLQREAAIGETGGYRALCVTPSAADAENGCGKTVIAEVKQLRPLDPFTAHAAAECFSASGITFVTDGNGTVTGVRAEEAGAWICVRGADFGDAGACGFVPQITGGTAALLLDSPEGSAVSFDAPLTGCHDLYLVLSDAGCVLTNWQFTA